MAESCSNCRFHHAMPWSTETAQGIDHYCRFDPPQFVVPSTGALLPVREDGWCGKWQSGKPQPAIVPAPRNAPDTERSPNLSVQRKTRSSFRGVL